MLSHTVHSDIVSNIAKSVEIIIHVIFYVYYVTKYLFNLEGHAHFVLCNGYYDNVLKLFSGFVVFWV